MFAPIFGKIGVIVYFKSNQAYIAKNLCIQREMKNNACQGNCFLAKKLKKVSQDQENAGMPESIKKLIEMGFIYWYHQQKSLTISYTTQNNILYKKINVLATSSYSHDIFHPPC